MKKRVSIGDLAKELGLSVSTVSRALHNLPSISPATRQRVWKLARERHYQANQLATSLRSGKSRLVGVLVPTIDAFFFGSVVRGIERVAQQAGYHILICQSNEETRGEQAAVQAMINAGVAGVLASLAHMTQNLAHFDSLTWQGIPLVLFDRTLEGPDVNAVVVDDYQGAYDMVAHLLSQSAQRIALLIGPEHLNIYRNRFQGYRDALLAANRPLEEALIFRSDMSLEAGRAGMKLLLQDGYMPDAVFAAGDTAALGALQVLREHKLRVPDDVLLAGFGNEAFSPHLEPALTTVDQGCEPMGEAAIRLLLGLLSSTGSPEPALTLVLRPEVVLRRSSQREAVC